MEEWRQDPFAYHHSQWNRLWQLDRERAVSGDWNVLDRADREGPDQLGHLAYFRAEYIPGLKLQQRATGTGTQNGGVVSAYGRSVGNVGAVITAEATDTNGSIATAKANVGCPYVLPNPTEIRQPQVRAITLSRNSCRRLPSTTKA